MKAKLTSSQTFRLLRVLLATFLLALVPAVAAVAQGTAPSAPSGDAGLWARTARFVVDSQWATIGLLVVGCLLLFIDLLTPHTWGVSGTLGALSVITVFAAHLAVGGAGWIGVIVFLAGLTLLLLEIHVIPGHGMAAIAGLMLLFLGMFWALGGTQHAVFALSVSTILTVVSLIGFFAYLPKSPAWKVLGQQMQQRAALGYVTSENLTHFLGRTGTALTVLRPAGAAEIDGTRLDVVTEGEFLEAGTALIVIRVEGSRVVVDDVATSAVAFSASAASEAA